MKKLLNIFAYMVLLFVVYVAIINISQSITIEIGAVKDLAKLGIPEISKTLSVGVYSLIILAVGFVTGLLIVGQFYFVQKDKLNAYKRELEKSSVSNSTSSSKVEVLEAKIATLEKALDSALNNKQ